MAITTTRINGECSLDRGYDYYANVIVDDTIRRVDNEDKFLVTVNCYLVNGGVRTNSGGWTKYVRINDVDSEAWYSQTIDTTGVAKTGGEVNVISKTFYVPVSMQTIGVYTYLTKSSYTSYDPGECITSGYVSMPKVQSMWNKSLYSISDVKGTLSLPFTQYVSTYRNVVLVTNSTGQTIIKNMYGVVANQEFTFTESELNTLFTVDNNANQLPLVFYMDLYTFTDNTWTTQIGTTQRLKCEAYIVNGEPTATYTIVEQDAKVISLLGGSSTSKIIKNASDLLFTITPTALNSATIKNVKVNDTYATKSGNNYVLNVTDITTGTFNIVVTDSRGLIKTYTATKTLLDYIACNINNWSIERETQVSSNLVLNANVSVYNDTIDGNTNTIIVKYSIDNENWVTIPSSSYSIADNVLTISNLTLQSIVEYTNTITFYLDISDLLSETKENYQISKGVETWSVGENDIQVNGIIYCADEEGNNPVDISTRAKKLGKLLWSGDFTSGSISVDGLNDYLVIMVNVGGCYCFGSRYYGLGGVGSYGSYATGTYNYRLGGSGDTITIDNINKGGSDGSQNVSITAIYGIF